MPGYDNVRDLYVERFVGGKYDYVNRIRFSATFKGDFRPTTSSLHFLRSSIHSTQRAAHWLLLGMQHYEEERFAG